VGRHIQNFMQRIWYEDSFVYWIFLPLSWLFAGLVSVRRIMFERGMLRSFPLKVPVVVVGNITVGGTGKTPVVIWLAQQLKQRGIQPGIVSRGYGGSVGHKPMRVTSDSDPDIVGDEAVLLAQRSACPVIVHPNRIRAAQELSVLGIDVIIADDGLQHYRLARQFEIAVIDGMRGFGNGKLFPAGPLREPVSRLESVDYILVNKSIMCSGRVISDLPTELLVTDFCLKGTIVSSLNECEEIPLTKFAGREVHAVAALGNPSRFFRFLESHGLQVIEHTFPDHSRLTEKDLRYDDELDVLMTEKDAVKCSGLSVERCWYVPVEVEVDHPQNLLNKLQSRLLMRAE
jgi:tetraacyldisaccharide 4'-kinase